MIRWLACALFGLGACAQIPRQSSTEQLVIVIDEAGRRVPGAMVELRQCEIGPQTDPSEPAIFTALADRSGVAHFRDLPAWGYYCEAYLEPRASLPQGIDFIETATMPGEPVTLTVQELHVGGLNAPGLRWVAFNVGHSGPHFFQREEFRYLDYVKEVNASLVRQFPAARFLSGLRDYLGNHGADLVEVTAEWYGYQPMRYQIQMQPASQFRDPQLVRPEDLQPCAWIEIPVRLTEPGGAHVPPGTRDAILRRSRLLRWPLDGNHYHSYAPSFSADSGWTIAAPCADYRFKWLDTDWRWGEFLSSPQLRSNSQEIAAVLPAIVRLVRVHVKAPPGEFSITPQYEVGTETSCRPGPDGVVELILPPGDWELELEFHHSDHRFARFTRTITVEDVDAQDLVWALSRD